MIFGLDVLMKFNDVRVAEIVQDLRFVEYFILPRFLHSLDGNEVQLSLFTRLEYD